MENDNDSLLLVDYVILITIQENFFSKTVWKLNSNSAVGSSMLQVARKVRICAYFAVSRLN